MAKPTTKSIASKITKATRLLEQVVEDLDDLDLDETEEEEEDGDDEDEEEEEPAPRRKKTATKKTARKKTTKKTSSKKTASKKKGPTADDVREKLREVVEETSSTEAKRILKEVGDAKTVPELDEDLYQDVIDAADEFLQELEDEE